jgi:hypothetical protein
MYTNILTPTDGSELAAKAVQHGIALAKGIGAKVTVLTVLPLFHVFTTDPQMIEDTPAQYKARMQERAEEILGTIARAAQVAGVAGDSVHFEDEQASPTGRSSIPRRRNAVTASSWPRMAATASLRSSSAAKRSKCSRIARFRCSSIDELRCADGACSQCPLARDFPEKFDRLCRQPSGQTLRKSCRGIMPRYGGRSARLPARRERAQSSATWDR